MFEQLGKGLLKQTTSCLLEQVVEKLMSSELCKQIRSNKLCSVSGLTNLQHFVIVYGVVTIVTRMMYDVSTGLSCNGKSFHTTIESV